MKQIQELLQRDLEHDQHTGEPVETPEYQKWVEWRVKNEAPPMTRTQSLLAQEILSHETLKHMLAQPGDLQSVFHSIQKYLKNKD